ncbi:HAD-IA family hydrolase [Nonomuraea sp. NPDC050790]|uniref:HAD-IA family hydrolase n=1 Tax=Nonomuraea sp. NPDC050790 TaxID=3364371 RepID=UPI00378F7589
MNLTDVEAVLLDMDGTLVDTDRSVERAWTSWALEHGLEPEEVLAIAHGRPGEVTVRRLLPHLDEAAADASTARLQAIQHADMSGIVPGVGAAALLATLERRGLPWAVVTSADARTAKASLAIADIAPPLLLTLDDVTHGKPDPEGYLTAAARLGVDPARCLVVEDTAPGVAAGKAAGAVVAALKGVPADLAIDDLERLAALLGA